MAVEKYSIGRGDVGEGNMAQTDASVPEHADGLPVPGPGEPVEEYCPLPVDVRYRKREPLLDPDHDLLESFEP
ncbi:MAG: hypothetical protein KGL39_28925 [Patescibacteria group bacterium]|nr:hypothetical protein [Patescibacteria group bacterium]